MGQACHRGDPGSILYHVKCVPDKVALGQVCAGHIGTGIGLYRTQWHWDRFVPDTVALGQVCAGHSGTGTGFSPTTSIVPHQGRYSNAPF